MFGPANLKERICLFRESDRSWREKQWTSWRRLVELSKTGAIDLICRATDSRGRMQPEKREAARLDGYVNNWYIAFTASWLEALTWRARSSIVAACWL